METQQENGGIGSTKDAFHKKSLFQSIFHDLWAIRHRLKNRTVISYQGSVSDAHN